MNFFGAFKSKTRQAILLKYLGPGYKGEGYHGRGLAKELVIPSSMVSRELKLLEKEGLLKVQKYTKLLAYTLNEQYPLLQELREVFNKVHHELIMKQVF